MSSIIITGGSGFIGQHLIRHLLSGNRWKRIINIDIVEMKMDDSRYFQIVENICKVQEHQLQLFPDPISHIVHLAARPGVRWSTENPIECCTSNIMGTVAILEIARKMPKLEKILIASSSSIYGEADVGIGTVNIPGSPGFGSSIESSTEDNHHKQEPKSIYAASKKSVEVISAAYSSLFDLNITCLRLFTVYGPNGRPDMCVYSFIDSISRGLPINIFGDGTATRDFTYIDDAISGIVLGLDDFSSLYSIFNIAGGQCISLIELIGLIETNIGKSAKSINFTPQFRGDVCNTKSDLKKSKNILNYNPSVNIQTGIKKTVEWYLNHQSDHRMTN